MARFHHVNLGVPPDQIESEVTFLVDVLGYRPVELDEQMKAFGARWYESEDGLQVHLSADPDHQPAARAHVAIAYGPQLDEVEARLQKAEVSFNRAGLAGLPEIINCRDPAGNLWELRGEPVES